MTGPWRRALRAAGTVLLGKTNVPPALADWQSDNPIYGRTSNPWDTSRTPGGSSGGSAAALAAGLTALEVGSDIGGSIRVPAAFCGVYGHRPSETLVPKSGQFPMPPLPNAAVVMGVQGPLARSAEDLDLALSVLAGPDVGEDVAWRVEAAGAAPQAPRRLPRGRAPAHPVASGGRSDRGRARGPGVPARAARVHRSAGAARDPGRSPRAPRAVPLAPVRGDERARGRGDAPPARRHVREARTTSSHGPTCAGSRAGRATTSCGMAGASSSARAGARSSRSGTCCWPRPSTCSRIRTSSAPGRRMTAT